MPRTPVVRACARSLAAAAVAVPALAAASSAAAAPANLITLRPASLPHGGWTTLVEHPEDVVTAGRSGVVTATDRRGRAGYVMVGTRFADRTAVGVRARVRIDRLRLRAGRARAVIEVVGTGGVSLRAGVVGTGRGLRWAVWRTQRDGTVRGLRVGTAVRMRTWAPMTMSTRWARPHGGATLRVDGRVVARTGANLSGVIANRVNVGLGRPSSGRETGRVRFRSVATWGSTPAPPPSPGPAASAAPATAPVPDDAIPGREIARLDFENGFGRAGVQAVSSDRIQAVTTPTAAEGRYAGRFEVRNGDNPIGYGDRAELLVSTGEQEGQERWYTWATMFDRSYPMGGGWQVVTQWHSTQDGSPPVGFYAENGRYRLQVWPRDSGGNEVRSPITVWSTPIQTGVWYRMKMHVKWSGRDDVGFVELWVNGQQAGRVTARTMYPGYGNYFKFGYYRQSGISQTGIVYHDGFRATQVSP